MIEASHPILSCEAARELEAALFGGDEAKEWPAMQRAGRAIAAAILADFAEIGGFPANGTILVLMGKGHNGGDALIAAHAILQRIPAARAEVVFALGERALRPLTAQAWRELSCAMPKRLRKVLRPDAVAPAYDVCIDGVFGFQFRPPVEGRARELLQRANATSVRLRAAVDLPSAGLFRADFTYATGIVKKPIVGATETGRVRYLDLGFFRGDAPGDERVLTPAVLAPLAALRPALSDKRTYGHVLVLGGSRSFPGAILMTVLAALRSGVGLVTAFVPESVAAVFAARAPEAMWVAWPETPEGGLALEGEHLLRTRLPRATALVLGPGLGRDAETLALVKSVVAASRLPLVLDADSLQAETVTAGDAPRILTPHGGEFSRIDNPALGKNADTTLVLKGPATKVCRLRPGEPSYHSFFGGPVLARGGSGDLLAGLIGGLLAQSPTEPLLAAARGVVWHGLAADRLARAHGQTAVSVTQLLDFLPAALRESMHEQ